MRTEEEVLSQIYEWSQGNDSVRAVILTGSRADPKRQADFLSDYDLELYVMDLRPFQKDDAWLSSFGSIMVRWPLKPGSTFDEQWLTRLVLFKDSIRIDFQITDVKQIHPIHYDEDYRVIIDKDDLTLNINQTISSKYITMKPSRQEYITLIHEFWWDAAYVAKYLWRDELPFAKYMLDYVLRHTYLQKLIEWHIGLQHDWNVNTGPHGRWFKHYLDAEMWTELESTYAGSNINDNWIGFFRMVDLFKNLASRVSAQLGYEYPNDLEANMIDYYSNIRENKIDKGVQAKN